MTVRRYVGLAGEAEYGESPPPEAKVHLDITSATLDPPSDTQMFYGGGLQRSARLSRPGFYSPEGDIVYACDVNSVGYLLAWALGGYLYRDGDGDEADQNRHEIWGTGENVLPSFCARVGKDHFEHVFSGCVVGSLELSVEDEFVQVTASINAKKDRKADLKAIQDLLLPEAYPLAFYEVQAEKKKKGADWEDISAKVKSLTINVDNNTDADAGRSLGSRHPQRIMAGERETTISKPMFYEGSGPLAELWGQDGEVGPDGPEPFELRLTFDAGEYGRLILYFPRVIYSEVQQQPSERDEITQETEARALLGDVVEVGPDGEEVEIDTEIRAEIDTKAGKFDENMGGLLKIYVEDDADGSDLEGARVEAEQNGRTWIGSTDEDGLAVLFDVGPGEVTLKVEKAGYDSDETTVTVTAAEINEETVALSETTE